MYFTYYIILLLYLVIYKYIFVHKIYILAAFFFHDLVAET